jgi:hypothetical protein
VQVNDDLATDPVDVVTPLAAQRPRDSRILATMALSSPLSLSVLMSPFWQNAHRMLQDVKKIVPACRGRTVPPRCDGNAN